jgi:predicted amidophosphoribosyltransferase
MPSWDLHIAGALRAARDSVLHLLWPRLCPGCRAVLTADEDWCCLECAWQWPWTDYERQSGHRLERQFWGRMELEAVWAAWHMARGSRVQHFLHEWKYRGRPDLGRAAGRAYGQRVLDAQPALLEREWVLVPVPMAPSKQRSRGHNPAEDLALGIQEAWHDAGVPVRTERQWLQRLEGRGSQTRMDRGSRWQGLTQVYRPGARLPERLDDQAVMLIDDVVTTGATFEACGQLLRERGACLTVLALAAAD